MIRHPRTQARPARVRPDGTGIVVASPCVVPGACRRPARQRRRRRVEQDPAARALLREMARLQRVPPDCERQRANTTPSSGRPANASSASGADPDATPRQVARRGRAQRRLSEEPSCSMAAGSPYSSPRITSTAASRKSGTLDQALVYMVRDLHATMPLARMFTTEFPASLDAARDVRQRSSRSSVSSTSRLITWPCAPTRSTCSCGSPGAGAAAAQGRHHLQDATRAAARFRADRSTTGK